MRFTANALVSVCLSNRAADLERVPARGTPERAARRAGSLAAHVPRFRLAVRGMDEVSRDADRVLARLNAGAAESKRLHFKGHVAWQPSGRCWRSQVRAGRWWWT